LKVEESDLRRKVAFEAGIDLSSGIQRTVK
jgi:hypothetical protein